MDKKKIYAEVTFVLEQFPSSYINLIPQTLIDEFKSQMSTSWYMRFDKEKVFYKQNIQKDTVLVLAFLYYKYLCTNESMKRDFIKDFID